MVITTTASVPGSEVGEVLGIVSGRAIVSELAFTGVTKGGKEKMSILWNDALQEAHSSLEKRAAALGAEAVIGVRQDCFVPFKSLVAIVLTGTAVKLAPLA